jgi:hypothetical protein
MLDLLHQGLPLAIGYAETHFRFFRLFPSLLYRSFPEVIFDMPRRLAPGRDLPVVLILNDVDRFPVTVREMALAVSAIGSAPRVLSFGDAQGHLVEHPLAGRSRVYLLTVPNARLNSGVVHVNGKVTLERNGRVTQVLNDNLPGSSHFGLTCRVCADTPLPGQDWCSYGDVHVHTQFSESHVEFGLPVPLVLTLSSAYGLDFVGLTDHSYDLAASLDDYLTPDPGAARWEHLVRNAGNGPDGTRALIGEELSCLNARGKVVHLGGLGMSRFVPGSLDGARPGRRREPQLTVQEAAAEVHAQGGIVFAAHPGARSGLLQSLLLDRGSWGDADINECLDGFQAVNGSFETQWQHGRALWVRALLRGLRLPLLAGNDAHGDFNRYRCIGTPFLSVYENHRRHLGYTRTGVYGRPVDTTGLIDAFRSGRTFATSGPYLALSSSGRLEDSVVGQILNRGTTGLRVLAGSSEEFGPIEHIWVYGGIVGEKAERVLLSFGPGAATFACDFSLPDGCTTACSYLRAECCSRGGDGALFHAASSPVYFDG